MEDKHTLFLRRADHGVSEGPLQVVRLVFVVARHLGDELFPPGAADVLALYGVVKGRLHGEEVCRVVLPEGEGFKVIGSVAAVYQVRVGVELCRADGQIVPSVLHEPVPEPPVAHV